MKSIRLFIFFFVVVSACKSPKNEMIVPDKVKQAFEKLYPTATDVRWIQEPSIFEAKFTDGKMKGAVSFNDMAEIMETEEVIEKEQLPNLAGVLDYIHEHYEGETVTSFEKITKQGGQVSYELQITGKELIFDAEGKFLEEEPD